MTTEQKAKAYDEAKVRMSKAYNSNRCTIGFMNEIFPELKESEDERIRKELLEHCINRRDGKQVCVDASDYRRWADWLSRQAVENIPILPYVKSDKEISNEIIEFLKLPHPQFVGKRHQEDWIVWLEKQGEQKDSVVDFKAEDWYVSKIDGKIHNIYHSVDKVKPKFHEGEWTVSNLVRKTRQISEVHFDEYNSYYVVDKKHVNLEEYDRLHHLWTIQDAKNGDVLVASDGSIFLFAGSDDYACKYYVALTTDNVVNISEGLEHYWETSRGVHPATKEQREQLEKAMADAGWEFDFDKRELKKIEQKTAWSEEDETVLNNLIYALANDRIGNNRDEYVDWLKSLKDTFTWKPSDEQMKVLLSEVTAWSKGCHKQIVLESLYQDLKKLKA